jgi:hypothetical protein
MFKHIAFLFFLTISLNTWAASTTTTINKIQIYETDMLISVWLNGGTSAQASCDSVGGAYISFSITRPMAKEYLTTLLSAQSQQATVTVWGANDCIDQTDVETLLYFQVHRVRAQTQRTRLRAGLFLTC